MAMAMAICFRVMLFRSALRAFEDTRPIFLSSVCAAIFSLLAGYPLIVYLGRVGAIVGIAMAYVILLVCLWISLRIKMAAILS